MEGNIFVSDLEILEVNLLKKYYTDFKFSRGRVSIYLYDLERVELNDDRVVYRLTSKTNSLSVPYEVISQKLVMKKVELTQYDDKKDLIYKSYYYDTLENAYETLSIAHSNVGFTMNTSHLFENLEFIQSDDFKRMKIINEIEWRLSMFNETTYIFGLDEIHLVDQIIRFFNNKYYSKRTFRKEFKEDSIWLYI